MHASVHRLKHFQVSKFTWTWLNNSGPRPNLDNRRWLLVMELCESSAQSCPPCMETGIGLQQPPPSLECSQHYFGLRAISDLTNQCRPWVEWVIQGAAKSKKNWNFYLKRFNYDDQDLTICINALMRCSGKLTLSSLGCPVMTLCWLGVLNQFWLDKRPDALRSIQGAPYLTWPSCIPDLPHVLTSSQNRSEIPVEEKTAARHDCS